MADPRLNRSNGHTPTPYVPRPEDEEAIIDDQSLPSPPTSKDEEAGTIHHGAPLRKSLSSRHIEMIGFGGAIGAGLFVGSGGALSAGGAGSVLIVYVLVGVMVYNTCQALAELAVLYPVNGAFFVYMVRFISPSCGFAVGWIYVLVWLAMLPFEMVAAAITIDYWRSTISHGVWYTIILVILCLIQFLGVKGYGEVEFGLSLIKIAACVGFIILGIVINAGGVGDQGYLGFKYWSDPGTFINGFPGFCLVFVVASQSFGGTELVGLAAAETASPRVAIPKASKQVIWRILFFYIVCLLIVSVCIPANDPRLISTDPSKAIDVSVSPFIIAIDSAGIQVLPHIMNVVILLSVISVANSCTYGSTRTMQAMASYGMAPRALTYVDSKGRPVWCILIQMSFGLLAFIGLKSGTIVVFNWLVALSGLSFMFVWGSINLAHIRFRRAFKMQGHSLDRIPYQAAGGVWGSYIGLALSIMCVLGTVCVAIWKSIPTKEAPNASVTYFFEKCLSVFTLVILGLFWKFKTKDWSMMVKLEDVDLMSGIQLRDENEEPEPPRTWKNLPKRILGGLF